MLLRDKFWLWGHPEGRFNNAWGNTQKSRMTPMECCLYLGARNTFMVPMDVEVNRRQYNKSFKTLNQVGWECYAAVHDPAAVEPLIQDAKGEEHKGEKIVADPIVKLPTAETIVLPEDKQERLSVIIAEINSKTGKAYDNDVAIKAMLQIRDLLMKSERLRTSAKTNTIQDFEFSYFDDIDDALIEGLSQNQDFFSLLLNNEEIKHQVLGIFTDEIYKSLRNAE